MKISSRMFGCMVAGVLAFAGSAQAALGSAQAALVSCGSDGTTNLLDRVDTSSACQYLTPADNNNKASIVNINTAGFFGTTNWLSNGQTQLDGSNNVGQSGSWSILDANFSLYDYIIVFKDGNGTNLTAFLFNETAVDGTWRTPFTDPPFALTGNSNSKNVSHLTIAKRATGTPVPEPVSLALLGAGLMGIAVVRRKQKSAKA